MADVIRQHAAEYAELSRAISEVDYAPSAVTQQTAHIQELKEQLKLHLARLEQFSATAQKERKEWEALRDSSGGKLKARITGKGEKWDAKVKKEEQEYLLALEEVHKGVAQRDAFNVDITEAEGRLLTLKRALSRHEELEGQISDLLEIVFGGPTPGFPEEDRLEQGLKRVQIAHDSVQARFKTESQAASLLADANVALQKSKGILQKALDNPMGQIVFDDGADVIHSGVLGAAMALSTQINTFVILARKASDKVGPIPSMEVPTMSNTFFDTGYLIFKEKIMEAKESAGKVERRLTAELQAANKRVEAITPDMKAASKNLQQARSDLFHARDTLLKRFGEEIAGLPAYEASSSPTPASLNPYADALAQHAAAAVTPTA